MEYSSVKYLKINSIIISFKSGIVEFKVLKVIYTFKNGDVFTELKYIKTDSRENLPSRKIHFTYKNENSFIAAMNRYKK